ncbi:hypothetical protein ZWY2020_016820 [Hordeum vulgare]|nr:hypothetical protein ZWY2020_016820 [Hordeum vulgare]
MHADGDDADQVNIDVANVDEYNANGIAVDDDDDKECSTGPGMGNSKSKATQDDKVSDVPTVMYAHGDGADEVNIVVGNIDEYNAMDIAVADNDDNECSIGPDVIGIFAYVAKIQTLWDPIYDRHVPFLEIGLMNFRFLLTNFRSHITIFSSMEGVPAPQEVVHAPTDVQLQMHVALPAPLADAYKVHAVEDAIDYIFQWITNAQEDEALNTIWIRSARPYHIEISLRVIRETIYLHGQVHPDCFNIAVRKLASAEVETTAGTKIFGKKHFFDLRFHSQARALRHSWTEQGLRTTALIDNAIVEPFPKYDVFNSTIHLTCVYLLHLPQYLLPFTCVDSSYALLVDSIQLRKQLMIQMLTIKHNEAAGNIPAEIREALRVITD